MERSDQIARESRRAARVTNKNERIKKARRLNREYRSLYNQRERTEREKERERKRRRGNILMRVLCTTRFSVLPFINIIQHPKQSKLSVFPSSDSSQSPRQNRLRCGHRRCFSRRRHLWEAFWAVAETTMSSLCPGRAPKWGEDVKERPR